MNSMFILTGEVVNVFTAPKGISKKTGEEYGGQDKVQIMGNIPLPDGQYRKELVDLTTDQGEAIKKYEGKEVTCPVSFYVSKSSVGYFVPKGHQITPTKSFPTPS
jgi:hypothetical protein